jgi:hypothetical protein
MTLMNGTIHRRTAVKFVAAANPALGASSVPLLARAARYGPSELVKPGAGAWRTWLLMSVADLRPPPPLDSLGELDQAMSVSKTSYCTTTTGMVTTASPPVTTDKA